MKKLFVFLGNPGINYKNTRHNIGWMVCDNIGTSLSFQKKFHGQWAKEGDVIYLKPETYMNESGISVREAMDFFKIKIEDVVVVHDDSELDFGQIELQKGGALRGHNGLRSISKHCGDNFKRLRFGIGRPRNSKQDLASFVLSGFDEIEKSWLSDLFKKAQDILAGEKG